MSFFDFLTPLIPSLITAGVTLYTADQKENAQNKATNTANQANAAATAAQEAGITAATNNTNTMQAAASPGLIQQEQVMNQANSLTPLQKQGIADAQRTTLDALQGGDLRGSARATVAAVNQVNNLGYEQDIQANQQRADAAGAALTGQYFTSGNNLSNLALQGGKVASAGLVATGQNNANSTLNNAATTGQAIGNIGSVISSQMKQNNTNTANSAFSSPDTADGITWNAAPSNTAVDYSTIGSNGAVDGANTLTGNSWGGA